jgi:hypothetical protein
VYLNAAEPGERRVLQAHRHGKLSDCRPLARPNSQCRQPDLERENQARNGMYVPPEPYHEKQSPRQQPDNKKGDGPAVPECQGSVRHIADPQTDAISAHIGRIDPIVVQESDSIDESGYPGQKERSDTLHTLKINRLRKLLPESS